MKSKTLKVLGKKRILSKPWSKQRFLKTKNNEKKEKKLHIGTYLINQKILPLRLLSQYHFEGEKTT